MDHHNPLFSTLYPTQPINVPTKDILWHQFLIGFGIFCLCLLGLLPQMPSIMDQGRDSGIFAYTAKVIAEGGLPYADAWDNKPPGVYYINALAFRVFGVNRWALWLVELGFLVASSAVFYRLIKLVYSRTSVAVVGTACFILITRFPGFVVDGNYTESYALLPQLLTLVLGYRFLIAPSWRLGFLMGLASSMAFLIKQTTIGVAVSFIPAVLLTGHTLIYARRRWYWLGTIILGGLTGLGMVGMYLSVNGVLDEAILATIISPVHLHAWISERSVNDWNAVFTLQRTYLLVVAALVVSLVYLLFATAISVYHLLVLKQFKRPHYTTFVVWVVLMFVADTVLTNITTRFYYHYYITPALSASVLVVISLDTVARIRQQRSLYRLIWGGAVFFVALAIIASIYTIVDEVDDHRDEILGEAITDPLSDYVEMSTQPEDIVLVWGASSEINFQSLRDSPTQYHYAYPLIVPSEDEEIYINQMMIDLQANQPSMIIDTTLRDGDRVPPLNPVYREQWWAQGGRKDVADLSKLYTFVAEHCWVSDLAFDAVIFRCYYGPNLFSSEL